MNSSLRKAGPVGVAAFCALLFAPCDGLAGQKNSPSNAWTTAPVSALQIAQNMDRKIHGLGAVSLGYGFEFRDAGGQARFIGHGLIKSQKVFHLEYPSYSSLIAPVDHTIIVSDGKRIGAKLGEGKPTIERFPGSRKLPANVFASWMRYCVPDMFTAIGTRQDPFTQFLRSVPANKGYQVVAQMRTVTLDGHPSKNYRIFVSKRVKGKFIEAYEILVDPRFWLPTQFNNSRRVQGGVIELSRMRGMDWNFEPKQRFDPSQLSLQNIHLIPVSG